MKNNIVLYYLLISLPLALLAVAIRNHFMANNVFALSLMVYCLVYHPAISGLRLLASGKINKSQYWLNFVPFWNKKYFKFLFFNK